MATWFAMPNGVDSISVRQQEFHPKMVQDGKRLFSVPDHFAPEVEALSVRTGTGVDGRPVMSKFELMTQPEGVEDEPEPTIMDAAPALQGQILTLQVQNEGLRAQIAELTVERDGLKLRVAELELETGEAPAVEVPKPPSLRLTGTPADELLDNLAGMTLGKDDAMSKGKGKVP